MELWPESLILIFEGTASRINIQSEAPLLESWLLTFSDAAALPLVDRLAVAQDVHSRSTPPESELALDRAEAQLILGALGANRDVVDDHSGLLNLWSTLAALEL